MASASSAAEAWVDSGAMALTGRPDAAGLVPPDGIIERLQALGDPMGSTHCRCSANGRGFGFVRQGSVSCGGSARMLRALDDWIVGQSGALEDDRAAVAAWLKSRRRRGSVGAHRGGGGARAARASSTRLHCSDFRVRGWARRCEIPPEAKRLAPRHGHEVRDAGRA